MLRLMVNPAKVTTGEAVDILMIILSNGMARSASPKPTAERMKAQRHNSAAVIIMRVIVFTVAPRVTVWPHCSALGRLHEAATFASRMHRAASGRCITPCALIQHQPLSRINLPPPPQEVPRQRV